MRIDAYLEAMKQQAAQAAEQEKTLHPVEKARREKIKLRAEEILRRQKANARAEGLNRREYSAAMGWTETIVPPPYPEVPLHDGDDPGWSRVLG
jgi:hypothetical protein